MNNKKCIKMKVSSLQPSSVLNPDLRLFGSLWPSCRIYKIYIFFIYIYFFVHRWRRVCRNLNVIGLCISVTCQLLLCILLCYLNTPKELMVILNILHKVEDSTACKEMVVYFQELLRQIHYFIWIHLRS